jgi:hypothetical protein
MHCYDALSGDEAGYAMPPAAAAHAAQRLLQAKLARPNEAHRLTLSGSHMASRRRRCMSCDTFCGACSVVYVASMC